MAIEIRGRGYPLVVTALTDSTISLVLNNGAPIFINSSGVLSAAGLSGTISTSTSATELLAATTFSAGAFSSTNIQADTATATDFSGTNARADTATATTFSGVDVKATQVTADVFCGSGGATHFIFSPGGSAVLGAQTSSANKYLFVKVAGVLSHIPVFNTITASA